MRRFGPCGAEVLELADVVIELELAGDRGDRGLDKLCQPIGIALNADVDQSVGSSRGCP